MKKLTREFILKAVRDNSQPAVKVIGSKDAADYARAFYADDIDIYESSFIILLNRANNTAGWAKISQGGVAGTIVDIKIVCKYAIDALASSVIFVHNHPSGEIRPSLQDIQLSKRMKEALQLLDVRLLDSVIITSESYYSMQDNGDF